MPKDAVKYMHKSYGEVWINKGSVAMSLWLDKELDKLDKHMASICESSGMKKLMDKES